MNKAIPLAGSILLSFSTLVVADSGQRSELENKYLGPIGKEATSHNYDQLSFSFINEKHEYHNERSNDENGHEFKLTKTFSKHLYGIVGFSNIDEEGIESVKTSLGLGMNADLGFDLTNTDFYGEITALYYDTDEKVGSLSNSDDGITFDLRTGLRSDWGINNVDSRIYVGLSDTRAYNADSDGGLDGVIGASIGYTFIPELTLSTGIERMAGPEYSMGDPGLSSDDTIKKYITLSYNF